MPRLIKKTIKGRPKFDFEEYDKAKKELWNHIEAAPKKVPGNTDTEVFARKIDALCMHLGGMPLGDAAKVNGLTPASMYNFKSQWTNSDPSVAALLANMLEAGAVRSMVVFNKKAGDMDAGEAASAAATLTKASVTLRTGANTNYQPPEHVALEILDRVEKCLAAGAQHKQLKGKVIDI